MRIARIAAWVAACMVVAGSAGAVALDTLVSSRGTDALEVAGWVVVICASTGVGLLLAIRAAGIPSVGCYWPTAWC